VIIENGVKEYFHVFTETCKLHNAQAYFLVKEYNTYKCWEGDDLCKCIRKFAKIVNDNA